MAGELVAVGAEWAETPLAQAVRWLSARAMLEANWPHPHLRQRIAGAEGGNHDGDGAHGSACNRRSERDALARRQRAMRRSRAG